MEQAQDNENNVWTAKRLAAAVGLDPSRIRQLLIEDSELHGVKVGATWMIPEAEALRFIETRKGAQ